MDESFDQTRFIEALTRHQPALEAFCHANLANREDARDVLQATCVMLLQKAPDWNPETEFLPWAFTVARFTVLSHIRDRMRDRLVFDEDVVLAMASETEAAANDFDDRYEAVRHCLQKLIADKRDLLLDHYVAGRSLADIAEATRRGLSAVKMTFLRLRQQLGDCIERQMRTSP